MKSFESNIHILLTDAPRTFRISISFVRCSATKGANPKSPKQLRKIANIVNTLAKLAIRSSDLNFFPYSSSTNWNSNGIFGKFDFSNVGFILSVTEFLYK